MSSPNLVRLGAVGASLVWSIVLYLSGVELPNVAQHAVANLPTAAVLLIVAFDLWIWKLPGIRNLVGRPRLAGTWATTITPHPGSHIPSGGNRGPIDATTTIEQTFWTLAISMSTTESRSTSLAAHVERDGASKKRYQVTYTYRNTPKAAVRDRSPVHVGAVHLSVDGDEPAQMTASYWTDRLTVGDMEFTRTSN